MWTLSTFAALAVGALSTWAWNTFNAQRAAEERAEERQQLASVTVTPARIGKYQIQKDGSLEGAIEAFGCKGSQGSLGRAPHGPFGNPTR